MKSILIRIFEKSENFKEVTIDVLNPLIDEYRDLFPELSIQKDKKDKPKTIFRECIDENEYPEYIESFVINGGKGEIDELDIDDNEKAKIKIELKDNKLEFNIVVFNINKEMIRDIIFVVDINKIK